MKIKYIAESSFLETNKIYEVLGLVVTNQGLSYLIFDGINKFRLWESDDFEMVNIKTNTSRWNFYRTCLQLDHKYIYTKICLIQQI